MTKYQLLAMAESLRDSARAAAIGPTAAILNALAKAAEAAAREGEIRYWPQPPIAWMVEAQRKGQGEPNTNDDVLEE